MTGLFVLLAALAVTAVVALGWSLGNGRFRTVGAQRDRTGAAGDCERVMADEVGAPLGQRLTLLQFSSAFCTPCRATRVLLADVVRGRPDVAHVEVDAESHLDLVRRLDVRRTPTVVVLDAAGVVVGRASGLPRREQVEAVLADAGRD